MTIFGIVLTASPTGTCTTPGEQDGELNAANPKLSWPLEGFRPFRTVSIALEVSCIFVAQAGRVAPPKLQSAAVETLLVKPGEQNEQ